MQFQSPEHARSYRLACKAVAHARREAYRTAVAMTTPELRDCIAWYISAAGQPTGEALTQERMVRAIIAQRTVSSELARRGAAS